MPESQDTESILYKRQFLGRLNREAAGQYTCMKYGLCAIIPSLTVGKIKMATNPVNMGSVAVFYFVTICAIL